MLGVRRVLLLLAVVTALVGLSATVASAHYNQGHERACHNDGKASENNKHCDHDDEASPASTGGQTPGSDREPNEVPNSAGTAERGCRQAASEIDSGTERAYDRAASGSRRSNDVPNVTPHTRGKCGRVASEVDNQAEGAHGDGTETRGETERHVRQGVADARRRGEATLNRAEAQANHARGQATQAANDAIDDIQDELSD